MNKLNSLKELKILKNNSPEYQGKLSEYQNTGSKHNDKRYTQELNSYQNLLYKRALYGLNLYSKEELKSMHWERKRRIKRVNKRAQNSINLFKQERFNTLCDHFYKSFFSRSKLAKDLFSLEKSKTNPKIINTLELQTLGIRKEHIINRLVQEGILPKNFYELKEVA